MMPSDMIKREIEHLNEELERVIQNHQFMLNMETNRIYERINQLQSECNHIYGEDGVCVYCGKESPDKHEVEEENTEDNSEDNGAQEGEE